jgi:DNA-binding beta-propeller fold protein YncE
MRSWIALFSLFLSSAAVAGDGGVFAEPYGKATAGKGGIEPLSWVQGHPSPAQSSFGFTLEDGLGGAPGLLLTGNVAAAVPLLGFELAVNPFGALFLTPWTGVLSGAAGQAGAGAATARFPLPGDPNFIGLELHSQFVIFDAAGPQGFASSRGLRARLNPGPLAVLVGNSALETYDYLANRPISIGTTSRPVGAQFNQAGTLLFTTGRDSGPNAVFEIYDATLRPMQILKTVALGPETANHIVVHPDDKRAYVSLVDKQSRTPFIRIVDIDRSSASFGTVIGQVSGLPSTQNEYEGGSISANGRVLAVVELAIGGAARMHVIDVNPSSPNRDSVMASHTLLGMNGMLTDVAVDENGIYGYVCAASFGASSEFAQVFLPTGRIVAKTTTGSNGLFPTDIDIDPKGKFVVACCSNSHNLAVLPIDGGPQAFVARMTQAAGTSTPFSIGLSPDGQTVIAATQSKGMVAWDVASGRVTWTLPLQKSGAAMAVR